MSMYYLIGLNTYKPLVVRINTQNYAFLNKILYLFKKSQMTSIFKNGLHHIDIRIGMIDKIVGGNIWFYMLKYDEIRFGDDSVHYYDKIQLYRNL